MLTSYHGHHTQAVCSKDKICTYYKWQSFKISFSHVIVMVPMLLHFHPIRHRDYCSEVKFDIIHPNKNLLREHGHQDLPEFIIRWIGERPVQKFIVDYARDDITNIPIQLIILAIVLLVRWMIKVNFLFFFFLLLLLLQFY